MVGSRGCCSPTTVVWRGPNIRASPADTFSPGVYSGQLGGHAGPSEGQGGVWCSGRVARPVGGTSFASEKGSALVGPPMLTGVNQRWVLHPPLFHSRPSVGPR